VFRTFSFKFGFWIAILWALFFGIVEFIECHPHWSEMCGVVFYMMNFPGAVLVSLVASILYLLPIQFVLENGGVFFVILGMAMVAVVNGLLLGSVFYGLSFLGLLPDVIYKKIDSKLK
jgi:hypothetical protein